MLKKIIITIIVLLILVPSCIFAYQYFTKEQIQEEQEIEEKLKGHFKNLTIKVDASLATQPLMNSFVQYFASLDDLKQLENTYTNTHPAYEKLVNHETDLIIVTEPSKEELQMAKDANVELEVTKVVNEGFVFFVNAKNPIDNLKLTEIQDIYAGKINNWQEVGGQDKKIIAYQRPINSGSQTGMLSLVMKDIPLREPTTEEMIESMGGIVDVIADYDNNLAGIGYSYYYYASEMYYTPNIKFLAIDGIKPTYETIKEGKYPLMTAYYIVTLKNPRKEVQEFKEALLSKEGAQVAKEAGYVQVF